MTRIAFRIFPLVGSKAARLAGSAGTLALLFFQCLETRAGDGLKSECGVLTVDAQGISLAPSSATCPAITARGEPVWAVLMQPHTPPPVAGAPVVLNDKGQQPKREVTADEQQRFRDNAQHYVEACHAYRQEQA